MASRHLRELVLGHVDVVAGAQRAEPLVGGPPPQQQVGKRAAAARSRRLGPDAADGRAHQPAAVVVHGREARRQDASAVLVDVNDCGATAATAAATASPAPTAAAQNQMSARLHRKRRRGGRCAGRGAWQLLFFR